MTDDLAIAHWGEHCNGGAERVAWELQRGFNCPLFVGHRDPSIEPADLDDVRGLFDGPLVERAIQRGGVARALAYMLAWTVDDSADQLREYDRLITSGNETLYYCGPDDQVRVQYVHHTSRRHTDLFDAMPGGFGGVPYRLYAALIRHSMNNPTNRPDLFVANSEVVARRIHKYWGVPQEQIRVSYPPIDVQSYGSRIKPTSDYYLTLSRLDWHKHIDDVIRAINGTDRRLIVAGDGPDAEELQAIAGENVEFVGYVSEAEKRRLLSGAQAFIFNARKEDFGIASAEALASGTPVIGVEEGFTQHQIRPPKAGITYERGDLPAALDTFEREGVQWGPDQIAAHAEHFSAERFHDEMREYCDLAAERARVDVEWDDGQTVDVPQRIEAVADGGER